MTTVNNFIALNQPSSNIFQPTGSILPDRFNSITIPMDFSLVGEGISSVSIPDADIMPQHLEPTKNIHVQKKRLKQLSK
jgi:hypothetical protein